MADKPTKSTIELEEPVEVAEPGVAAAEEALDVLGNGDFGTPATQTPPAPETPAAPAAVPAESAPEPAPAEPLPQQETPAPTPVEPQVELPAPTPTLTTKEYEDALIEAVRARKEGDIDAQSGIVDGLDLYINQLLLGRRDDLIQVMQQYYTDKDSLTKADKDPNSFLSTVVDAMGGWNTGDNLSIEEVLVRNNKLGDRLVPQKECGIPDIIDGFPRQVHQHAVKVTGKEAKMLSRARHGDLIRVNLLNSGFWVAIKNPTIDELHSMFMEIDTDAKEIGRTIGLHYALISDMYFKQKFLELLISHQIIMASNFPDIYEPGAFIRNLSYHDYETLVYAVVALMTKNGLRLKLVCPECKHVSVEEKIDVQSTKFDNLDLFTPQVRAWWHDRAAVRSEKDLLRYRTEITPFQRTITEKFVNEDGTTTKAELTMEVPTFDKYFEVGQYLINKINDSVTAVTRGEVDKDTLARTNMTVRSYQMISPWISKLTYYQAEDENKVDFWTDDIETIMDHLDQSVQSNRSFIEGKDGLLDHLNQLTADTRFNFFGSVSIKCPKCGALPESKLDNFFAIEYQTVFFGLLFRLSLAGR